MDALPSAIRQSHILSANNLGQLANVAQLPSAESVEAIKKHPIVKDILDTTMGDNSSRALHLHSQAKVFLEEGDVELAWKILLV
jgi:hypothetical protein